MGLKPHAPARLCHFKVETGLTKNASCPDEQLAFNE